MGRDVGTFLVWALRAQVGSGPHAELARRVVFAVLVAQLLAGSRHEAPPHAPLRAPRGARPKRQRRSYRESLAGRRPRG